MTTDHGVAAPLTPALTVQIGRDAQTFGPHTGVAVIGRDAGAAMRISDDRISRWHVRLEPRRDGWEAIDTSTNGMYLDGVRRSSVLVTGPTTIHLGAPDGIPVGLTPSQPIIASFDTEVTSVLDAEPDEDEFWEGETDPGVARAGRAVAARRTELELTQRSLARDKIINAGTLIAFEKGRSWPRRGTLSKLEKALQWPPGSIARIRSGAAPSPSGAPGITTSAPVAVPSDQATEAFSDTVRAPLMAEAVELAMHSITAAITALPEPSDPDFTPRASTILADLRKLERLAANAARNAKGTPSVVLALSSVRRTYNDLMTRAARSPRATLGQRLHGARHRAEISLEEAANAAGLPIAVLEEAEADRPIPPDAAEAITTLIAQLTMS